ncbi:GtrA family protein [Tessaracoccus sp.]
MNWLMTKYSRYSHSVGQLFRFGVVGGVGVFVNFFVFVAAGKLMPLVWPTAGMQAGNAIWWSLPWTDFNVRWYHVTSTIAFFVANLFNFQLNRRWTFRSHNAANWLREYWPFLTVGLIAQAVGLLIMTALMHPGSVVSLPDAVFDNTTGLRTKKYWAQLIMIVCTIPITFLVNKFWTFRAVRGVRPTGETDHPETVTLEREAEA